jgi:hypothetical protein
MSKIKLKLLKSAQGFGFNSGVGFYNLGSGSGSPNSPNDSKNVR